MSINKEPERSEGDPSSAPLLSGGRISHWLFKILPWILIFGGIGSVLLALAADTLGIGGQAGFGGKQVILASLGGLAILSGLILRLASVQRFILSILSKIRGKIRHWIKLREQPFRPAGRKEIFAMVLLTAAWFGLVTGFTESLYMTYLKVVQDRILHVSQNYVWMVPLVDLAWALAFGLLVFLLASFWPRLASIRFLTFLFTFLACIALYYVRPKINFYAAIVLFFGAAFQLANIIGVRSQTFYAFMRRSVGWLGTALGIVMAGMLGFYL